MLLETMGAGLMLAAASIRPDNMSDKRKIDKIFEYTRTWVSTENGEIKKVKYVRKENIVRNEEVIGIQYVYQMPLGMPYKKLEYLNDNVGVIEDGLHKNVEIEYEYGMININVYEEDIVEKWDYENRGDKWAVPIGKTYKDLVTLDFDRTQNLVGGGSIRYGKTNLIKVIMTSLIQNNPNDAEIYLIDLKDGVEFERYAPLQQVKGVATNPAEAHELLENVMIQLQNRQKYFKQRGWSNVVETSFPKRTFVMLDEAGDLVSEPFMSKEEKNTRKECQWMLSHIARIGPAFGFREMFFSQYTTGDVLPRTIKQVSDAKICFKLQNGYASEVVLGEGNRQAAALPRIRGRAHFIDGPDMYELQVPYMSDEHMFNLLADYYEKGDVNDGVLNEAEETTGEGVPDTGNVIEFRDTE